MTEAIKERCSDPLARLLVRWAMAAVLGIRGTAKELQSMGIRGILQQLMDIP
jgi:hypothetical protein